MPWGSFLGKIASAASEFADAVTGGTSSERRPSQPRVGESERRAAAAAAAAMAAAEAEAEEQRVQATSEDLLNAAARVVVEAPRGDGGRQSLGAHDSSLLQDDAEDVAHEFINADAPPTSRRLQQ